MSEQALLLSKEDGVLKNSLTDKVSTDTVTNSGNEEDSRLDDKGFIVYRRRWLICIFFATSLIASGLGNVGFAAIATIVKKIYGVNDLTVTMLMLPFVIMFIPLIFPANYLFDNYGVKIPIYIATVALVIGAWVRMFVNYDFYFLLGGQVIMACGQPFILSAPAKIAGLWFGDNERALATMIGSLASPIGAVLGYLLPLPLVKDSDVAEGVSKEHGESVIFRYILIMNIIMTVCGVPIMLFIQNHPPTPPSASAARALKTKKKSRQCESIATALKNRDFIVVMISFSSIYCIYTTLGACVGPISEQFNYKSTANSVFGTVFIFSGLFGAFTHAFFLDKYKKFKLQFILIGFLCVCAMTITCVVIDYSNLYITSVALGFLGLAQLPIIGVSYSFTAELTYPLNEALTCGLLQLSGSVIASIFTFGIGYLLNKNHKFLALYLMVGVAVIGFLPQFFVRQNLKKQKAGIKATSFSFHVGHTSFVDSPDEKVMKKKNSGISATEQSARDERTDQVLSF